MHYMPCRGEGKGLGSGRPHGPYTSAYWAQRQVETVQVVVRHLQAVSYGAGR